MNEHGLRGVIMSNGPYMPWDPTVRRYRHTYCRVALISHFSWLLLVPWIQPNHDLTSESDKNVSDRSEWSLFINYHPYKSIHHDQAKLSDEMNADTPSLAIYAFTLLLNTLVRGVNCPCHLSSRNNQEIKCNESESTFARFSNAD
jgi:hypothetical protein